MGCKDVGLEIWGIASLPQAARPMLEPLALSEANFGMASVGWCEFAE
jgi:hypothetical protein